jgi:thiol:disulfide interchange protein DsbD
MPKSGGWLNAVKVTMGFIEIAAAMKFLSNADLVWDWGILTREAVISVWIAVATLTSLYLLGRFRLPHDTPLDRIGVMRMLFSMGFLAVGFWLLTGLFGGRLGEADAFLPPQDYPGRGNTSILSTVSILPGEGRELEENRVIAEGMEWVKDDYPDALAEAKATGKPIFIDFTGYTCTNCRWMEVNIFTKEDVRSLMKEYVLVRLYTDRREESNERNRQMQIDRFKTIDLPYYVVITPNDEVIDETVFTRDVDSFKSFLKRGLAAVDQSPQDVAMKTRN